MALEEKRICKSCYKEKPLSEYHQRKDVKTNGGYRYICKDCACERSKENYNNNKEKRIKRCAELTKLRIKQRREYVFLYLLTHCCVNCGENNPLVLEFDHINREEKNLNISRAVYNNWSWDRLKKEIEKCQVLCANCHRKKTSKENDSYCDLIEKYKDNIVEPEDFLKSIPKLKRGVPI